MPIGDMVLAALFWERKRRFMDANVLGNNLSEVDPIPCLTRWFTLVGRSVTFPAFSRLSLIGPMDRTAGESVTCRASGCR